jgi:hypothetical protein
MNRENKVLQHEVGIYTQEFIEELYACGYNKLITSDSLNRMLELHDEGKSAIQAAQIVYLELTRLM